MMSEPWSPIYPAEVTHRPKGPGVASDQEKREYLEHMIEQRGYVLESHKLLAEHQDRMEHLRRQPGGGFRFRAHLAIDGDPNRVVVPAQPRFAIVGHVSFGARVKLIH